MSVLPTPTWSASSWWLRGLTGLLPVLALLVAWPDLPSAWVWVPVAVSSLRWAVRPEDVAGAVALTFVVAWWGVHLGDALPWQVGVVAVLVVVREGVAVHHRPLPFPAPGARPAPRSPGLGGGPGSSSRTDPECWSVPIRKAKCPNSEKINVPIPRN